MIQQPELSLFSVELTDYLEGLNLRTYQEFGWFHQIVEKIKYYNVRLADIVSHNIIRAITCAFDNRKYADISVKMCISAAHSFDYDLFRPLFADKAVQEFVDRIGDEFLEYPSQTMQLLTQCITMCAIVAENGQVLDVN